MDLYITLAVTVAMMAMFIWGKYPYGLITMACCVILAATGVLSLSGAFSGFANQIVVLIAPTLALSEALKKTSLIGSFGKLLDKMKGTHGTLLILSFYAVGIIMAQFIPTTGSIAILIVFLATLGNTGDITTKRIMMPLLGVMVAWKFRTPIGLGATTFAMVNGFAGNILTENNLPQLDLLDPFLYAIVPSICLTIYCIFFWKLMPKDDSAIDDSKLKKQAQIELLPVNKQYIVYGVFLVVVVLMLFNFFNLRYLAPAMGAIVLIFTGCLKVPEAVKSMTCDMIWMIAGVLAVADALSASGASELIGSALQAGLAHVTNPYLICLIFSAVTVIMTTFLSNTATQAVLIPIAASICAAAGWDPRGLLLIIGTCNYFAIGFPSGSGEAAVTFAAAGYNPVKILKFTGPYLLIAIISCGLMAQFMYPLY